MKKRGFFIASAVAAVSAAAGAVAFKFNKERRTFTKEKWDRDVANRYKMADSLIRDHIVIGMTRNEVIELLGINGIKNNKKESMEYYIGLETEQPKILIIDFDEEDKVQKCTACV